MTAHHAAYTATGHTPPTHSTAPSAARLAGFPPPRLRSKRSAEPCRPLAKPLDKSLVVLTQPPRGDLRQEMRRGLKCLLFLSSILRGHEGPGQLYIAVCEGDRQKAVRGSSILAHPPPDTGTLQTR